MLSQNSDNVRTNIIAVVVRWESLFSCLPDKGFYDDLQLRDYLSKQNMASLSSKGNLFFFYKRHSVPERNDDVVFVSVVIVLYKSFDLSTVNDNTFSTFLEQY